MNKKILIAFTVLSAVIIGVSVNNLALSDNSNDLRVATVDLSQLITNSSSVQALKANHEKQMNEIEKTLEQARNEITNESNPEKIAELEEKYRREINDKKLKMDKDYNEKLMEIDKSIKAQVAEKAKSMNYTVVLPKNIVLFGGDDITTQIAQAIK